MHSEGWPARVLRRVSGLPQGTSGAQLASCAAMCARSACLPHLLTQALPPSPWAGRTRTLMARRRRCGRPCPPAPRTPVRRPGRPALPAPAARRPPNARRSLPCHAACWQADQRCLQRGSSLVVTARQAARLQIVDCLFAAYLITSPVPSLGHQRMHCESPSAAFILHMSTDFRYFFGPSSSLSSIFSTPAGVLVP